MSKENSGKNPSVESKDIPSSRELNQSASITPPSQRSMLHQYQYLLQRLLPRAMLIGNVGPLRRECRLFRGTSDSRL